MHDTYEDNRLPWSYQSFKPQIIKMVIQLGYTIWISLD